jgi:5-enolpyruvylshikimate-3-phosphate synthase
MDKRGAEMKPDEQTRRKIQPPRMPACAVICIEDDLSRSEYHVSAGVITALAVGVWGSLKKTLSLPADF